MEPKNYLNTFEYQERKQEQISHVINSSITAILNSCFDNSSNNMERQAAIEVAQDFGQVDLAQVLIERNDLINR